MASATSATAAALQAASGEAYGTTDRGVADETPARPGASEPACILTATLAWKTRRRRRERRAGTDDPRLRGAGREANRLLPAARRRHAPHRHHHRRDAPARPGRGRAAAAVRLPDRRRRLHRLGAATGRARTRRILRSVLLQRLPARLPLRPVVAGVDRPGAPAPDPGRRHHARPGQAARHPGRRRRGGHALPLLAPLPGWQVRGLERRAAGPDRGRDLPLQPGHRLQLGGLGAGRLGRRAGRAGHALLAGARLDRAGGRRAPWWRC